ncbi:hypothetical protein SISSUDRAFT_553774 [Sistotremastrum suecicum HHB10207 ss-3]|uniref:Uncharacterized protein n=1 Tax=Sistotremastrum suecicum HHB10207 ss-3 TaxID=1314776 RepID=A0A165XLS6_9AGAM|nr:hypothetical protein SISSUDRAFT_553774 [Sistotremastrum suecicum HHB10207 ss-3]
MVHTRWPTSDRVSGIHHSLPVPSAPFTADRNRKRRPLDFGRPLILFCHAFPSRIFHFGETGNYDLLFSPSQHFLRSNVGQRSHGMFHAVASSPKNVNAFHRKRVCHAVTVRDSSPSSFCERIVAVLSHRVRSCAILTYASLSFLVLFPSGKQIFTCHDIFDCQRLIINSACPRPRQ